MTFLDIVLGILLIYGLYKGLKNGLFVEIASLVALIAGIFGAIHFSYIAGNYLHKNMQWNENYINVAAFLITFVIIVFLIHLTGKLLTKIADFAMLGLLNKIAGALFGALKVAIILGAILVFFDRLNNTMNFINEETKKQSALYEPVTNIGAFVFNAVLKKREKEVSEE